jgi:hypothetical protein
VVYYKHKEVNKMRYLGMTDSEIWEGWCGNTHPKSAEGHFESIDDVRSYVDDRMSDWANEVLGTETDDDGNETERFISDMTPDEIEAVVGSIWNYFQNNQ